ncbi:hypothetical protein AMATHDRAFT_46450 [Amanita thiersii Skay4041]|uniref:Uncharacterized protein n=1 Tax=Amanita thiersii Skay4041 TaxID=703135 RepID=A0A2A9NVK6_9AGAR|nr:hypothetical protein AMATHDRAFT_46450 [Amanita thiersii Skay4041]
MTGLYYTYPLNAVRDFDDFPWYHSPTLSNNHKAAKTQWKAVMDDEEYSTRYDYTAWSPWETQAVDPYVMAPPAFRMRSPAGESSYNRRPAIPPPEQPSLKMTFANYPYLQPLDETIEDSCAELQIPPSWMSSSPCYSSSPSVSSDTTSSSSPSLLSPTVHVQQPLVLHQPRPCRRIPIISLSQLASACDEIDPTSSQTSTLELSPLPLKYLDFDLDPSCNESSSVGAQKLTSQLPASNTSVAYNINMGPVDQGSILKRTIWCSCGCMKYVATPIH